MAYDAATLMLHLLSTPFLSLLNNTTDDNDDDDDDFDDGGSEL